MLTLFCEIWNIFAAEMITSSNGNIFRVTGPLCGEFTDEFPSQRPVMQSFDVFFDLRLNKRLRKQSRGRWLEMPSYSLWRRCNDHSWKIFKINTLLVGDLVMKRARTAAVMASTFHPGQNGCHFGRRHFQMHFLEWKSDTISIQISVKFVLRNPTSNKPGLVQLMVWRQTGDKPLPLPMMTQFTDASEYAAQWGDELN